MARSVEPGMAQATNPTARTRSADPDRAFLRTAMDAPLLEREEEQSLAIRWRDEGDEKALHALTQAYMRLVIAIASKFRKYGLPFSDLVQEGNVGLMQAAARFEPEREVRFSTYAAWWIRSSIQDYVLRNWSIVRTGTTSAQKTLFFNLRRVRAMINDINGGEMSPENRKKTAKTLRVSEAEVEKMSSRLAASDRSLNAPFTEDGDGEWQDLLEDERPAPEEAVMQSHDAEKRGQWLYEAMECLTDREQLIIRERKLGDEVVTLEALGERLGISKERVRQIEHQALTKLKKSLTSRFGDPEAAGLI
ncbi:RNA polymerase factor sigma-32 [Hyphobacterium sp. HN65]|uniref:RNA polymerase factor sigma-32 n=2 Tax=Hyphobacterium lacteum TaxID=3116575 RepID=A0ABU7LQ48_9PROT|nr:RNA polymerase factor sigma-32 [Hyphobacterium sp. HN65]MEE2526040.1 RNA polymerase factor sigma-32 [Hyphobacterium sp. HN65]